MSSIASGSLTLSASPFLGFTELGGEGFDEAIPLGLILTNSLTHCILSGCGSLYLFSSSLVGGFVDDG